MIEKGYPVTWLFLVIIIVTYIGTYVYDLQRENDRLFNIATEQKATIEEQNETIRQMNSLIDTMFIYIEGKKPSNTLPKPSTTGKPLPNTVVSSNNECGGPSRNC